MGWGWGGGGGRMGATLFVRIDTVEAGRALVDKGTESGIVPNWVMKHVLTHCSL